jgi:hypothetical protein
MGLDGICEKASRSRSGTGGDKRMFLRVGNQTPVSHKATNYFTIFQGRRLSIIIIVHCRLFKEGKRRTPKIILIIRYKITSIIRQPSSTTLDEINTYHWVLEFGCSNCCAVSIKAFLWIHY